MFGVLDRYIARLIFRPMAATMALTIVLLLLDNMLRLFQSMLNAGAPLRAVFSMLLYVVPEYLALGVPISLLLGVTMAFRKLALDQELIAIVNGRVSPMRLMRVPVLFGILFVFLNGALVGFIQPYSEYAYREIGYRARLGAFGRMVKVGEIVPLSAGAVLMTEAFDGAAGRLGGIFLRLRRGDGAELVVSAKSGQFLRNKDEDSVTLRLKDGQVVTAGLKDVPMPGVLTYRQYDLLVPLPKITRFRPRGDREKELTLPELLMRGGDDGMAEDGRSHALAEAQKRIILILLPLVIPFLAAAVAVPPPRRPSAAGLVIGLALLIVEFKLLDFGVKVNGVPAALVLWPAFAAFLAITIRFFLIFGYRSGRHPLDGLYRLIALIPRKKTA